MRRAVRTRSSSRGFAGSAGLVSWTASLERRRPSEGRAYAEAECLSTSIMSWTTGLLAGSLIEQLWLYNVAVWIHGASRRMVGWTRAGGRRGSGYATLRRRDECNRICGRGAAGRHGRVAGGPAPGGRATRPAPARRADGRPAGALSGA